MHGGGPVILARLLQAFTPGAYIVATNRKQLFAGAVKTGGWLPASYYFLDEASAKQGAELDAIAIETKPQGKPPRRNAFMSWLANIVADALTLPDIRLVRDKIRSILVERPSVTTVYAASDNGTFLLGTYWAVKATDKRFVVHLFDLYRGNAFGPFRQLLARFYESRILQRANQIIVTSKHTQEYLVQRYGRGITKKISVIGHPLPDRASQRQAPTHRTGSPFEIIYTGTLGWPQKDCLVDLVCATRSMENIQITILAPYSPEQMAAWHLTGPHVEIGSVSPEEAERRQQAADILFLPMTFHPESHDIVATASPGKIAEYLESGKPILVYAPPFSHVARYAKETGFGLVVNQEGDEPLQEAIRRLQTDKNLQKDLVAHARQAFLDNHEEQGVLSRFRAAVWGHA